MIRSTVSSLSPVGRHCQYDLCESQQFVGFFARETEAPDDFD
jgi:hypothetical protein